MSNTDISRIDTLEGEMINVNSKLDGIASLLATLTSNMAGSSQRPELSCKRVKIYID